MKKRTFTFREEEKCSLKMTPMIDIVFLLLIFFMCSTKFKAPDYRMDANMPNTGQLKRPVDPPEDLVDLTITVEPKNVTDATFRIGRDLIVPADELPGTIKSQYSAIALSPQHHGREIPAVIRGHRDVEFRHIMKALDACVGAEIKDVQFAVPYREFAN